MKSKDTLFTKNNYDVQIEEVLDKKNFSDEAKGLILNVLYKIDMSYKDYSKIKPYAKSKNEIIEEILNIIENNCDKIEIMKVNESKNKFFVNKKEKSIRAFPNEVYILQALYYLKNTENNYRQYSLFDKVVLATLSKGFSINEVEIIRDFNGWSWNSLIENTKSRYYNMIYQDLLILLGKDNFNKLLQSRNIVDDLTSKLMEMYGERRARDLITKIEEFSILAYIDGSNKNENLIWDYLDKRLDMLSELKNKSEYISKITTKNNQLMKKVSKIDKILNSNKILNLKMKKIEVKQKYGNLKNYKNHLENLKAVNLNGIAQNNNLINPFEYVKRKKNLENEVKILNDIKKAFNRPDYLKKSIIALQRDVISCFYKKMEISELKRELINLVFEIRYYKYLPIDREVCLKDLRELDIDFRNYQKGLVKKLCKNRVFDIFAKDYSINYSILKYIFDSKMVNLNKILIKINYLNHKLYMAYYDENVLEKELNINFSQDDLSELLKKTERKHRVFL